MSAHHDNASAADAVGAGFVGAGLPALTHPGIWYCTERTRCQWQGYALNQGLGWGSPPSNDGPNSYRAWHDRQCPGQLIQLLPPSDH